MSEMSWQKVKGKEAIIKMNDCARCGNDHSKMKLTPLLNPTDDNNWYTKCPKTGQPIMIWL